jgi:hypothetical protein
MISFHNNLQENVCNLIIDKFEELNKKKIISQKTNDDIRIIGFEKVLKEDISDFFFDIDNKYSIKFFKKKPVYQTLMVNKTFVPTDGLGLGSGSGWHRDSYLKKQMKTIFYLSKVDIDNGPFSYLEPKSKFFCRYYPMKPRLSEDSDRKLKFCSRKIILTSDKPGFGFSIITNYPHRGLPVKHGVRYALTVYSSLNKKNERFSDLGINI